MMRLMTVEYMILIIVIKLPLYFCTCIPLITITIIINTIEQYYNTIGHLDSAVKVIVYTTYILNRFIIFSVFIQ